jgi:hypothetical protein
MLPNKIKLAGMDDFKRLGVYQSFQFEKTIINDITNIFISVGEGRSRIFWKVKPIGGKHWTDVNANSFYVFGREGPIGMLYRSRNNPDQFRIVCFPNPLRRLPRTSKKFRRRK